MSELDRIADALYQLVDEQKETNRVLSALVTAVEEIDKTLGNTV